MIKLYMKQKNSLKELQNVGKARYTETRKMGRNMLNRLLLIFRDSFLLDIINKIIYNNIW